MSASNSENQDVEVFHRVNRLKMKAGLAHNDPSAVLKIDPAAIDRAEKAIEKRQEIYPTEIKKVLNAINSNWKVALSGNKDALPKAMENIYHKANQVKDLASMFDYGLMQHFGLSLREFVEKIDMKKGAHRTIVQAHIDVMWVVYNEDLHGDGGPRAQELKALVTKAITKYS